MLSQCPGLAQELPAPDSSLHCPGVSLPQKRPLCPEICHYATGQLCSISPRQLTPAFHDAAVKALALLWQRSGLDSGSQVSCQLLATKPCIKQQFISKDQKNTPSAQGRKYGALEKSASSEPYSWPRPTFHPPELKRNRLC